MKMYTCKVRRWNSGTLVLHARARTTHEVAERIRRVYSHEGFEIKEEECRVLRVDLIGF